MAKTNDKLAWIEIDPETLSPKCAKLYARLKEQRKLAAQAKEAFEAAMVEDEDIPNGKRLVFGYNFGKLSTALADDGDSRKAPAKPKVSLSEYLAAMKATGRSA